MIGHTLLNAIINNKRYNIREGGNKAKETTPSSTVQMWESGAKTFSLQYWCVMCVNQIKNKKGKVKSLLKWVKRLLVNTVEEITKQKILFYFIFKERNQIDHELQKGNDKQTIKQSIKQRKNLQGKNKQNTSVRSRLISSPYSCIVFPWVWFGLFG